MTGAEIAAEFEAANAEAIDVVVGPAREHWQDSTPDEGWPVGVAARHIALGHELMASWARHLRTREPLTSIGDIHEINAEIAARGVVADPDEVADLLRRNGALVTAELEQLTPEHLAGEVDFGGQQMPAQMLATASIRHVQGHLASIKKALQAPVSE